jgi:predicted TIM-barrel fold metal-dependent hydrolase
LFDLTARPNVHAYFFVWNDFLMIPNGFAGIKWHRHSGEPVYDYETPQCQETIEEICRRRLPIVLEEEFHHTLNFVKKIAGRTVVIIPHMGALNGGYSRLRDAGLFDLESVWVDTALAQESEIEDFADRYGIDRILFGSDYPFGIPAHERQKLVSIFSEEELAPVLSGNLRRLLGT